MATNYNPRIVTDGLVLALDAGNTKSYDKYENLITDSEFNHIQQSGNTTATTGQNFAPYNRNTAVNFVNNGGAGNTYVYRNFNTSLASGTKYVLSIFSNSPSINFDQGGLAVGKYTLISSGVTSVSGGWYRHWNSYSAAVSSPNITPQVTVTPGQNITLSGWQMELSDVMNDYYQTGASVKTRGTTWTDRSGRGNNGTLTGGPTYSNGAIVFDGVDDYVNIPNAINLNNLGSQDFTVSMWVYRATNPPAGNGEMLYQSSTLDNGFVICVSDNDFRIELRDNESTNSTVAGVVDVFTANIWNNLVFTKQGTTYTGYSQGISRGSFTSYQNIGTSAGYVNLGVTDWWGPSHWEGNIAHVSVYNRALTATEIQQNYIATKSRYGL